MKKIIFYKIRELNEEYKYERINQKENNRSL